MTQKLKDNLEKEIYEFLFKDKKKTSLEEAFEKALGLKEEKEEKPSDSEWL